MRGAASTTTSLDARLRLWELVADVSHRFIDLPAADVDQGIEGALRRVLEATRYTRGFVAEFSREKNAFTITHRVGGLQPGNPFVVGRTLSGSLAPWVFGEIVGGREIVVTRDELPEAATLERRFFEEFDIRGAAYFPVAAGRDVFACLALNGPEPLDEATKPALRTVSQIFASALDRKRADARAGRRRELGALIADVSRRFAELPSVDLRAGLEDAISKISTHCGFIRAAVREVDEEGVFFAVTHRHVLPGEPDVRPFGVPIPIARYPYVVSQMVHRKPVLLSLETVPEAARAEREDLERSGNPQVLLIPMLLGTRTIGSVTFESRTLHDPDVVSALGVIGELFGNALERERTARELEERVRFEEALSDATARLLVSVDAIDAALDGVLSAVGQALAFERIGVSELTPDGARFDPRNEWCAPGVTSSRRDTDLSIEEFGWPFPELREGSSFVFGPAEAPPDATHIRGLLERNHARLVVLLPLIVGSRVLGCIAFRRVKSGRRPTEQQMQRLRVVAGIVASAVARRGAEARRDQVEVRLGQVVASALDGFVMVSAAGVVLDWTARAEQILGFSRLEMVGTVFTETLLAPDERDRLGGMDDIWAAARTRPDPRIEVTFRHRERGSVPVELSVTTLDGPSTTYAIFVRDITDRRIAEETRKRAMEEIRRQKTRVEGERDYLREELEGAYGATEFVGQGRKMREVFALIEAVASTSSTVLIRGESGVGKELVARAIHAASRRADAPLVRVNCASIPAELFESEFFGHVRGAFTGAHKDRIGRFELAHGGTLFLDEVGEIPLSLQAKLLRILQEGQFEKVGDDRTRTVDVRIVAATNRDLAADSAAGRFRKDLFYRLGVFPIEVPPLRERVEDIVPLAEHFLRQHQRSNGRSGLTFSSEQVAALRAYSWPGNVRELGHVIERAVIVSAEPPLRLSVSPNPQGAQAEGRLLTESELRELERRNLTAALERCRFRVSGPGGAAELLGMNPSTLRDRMRTFDIQKRK